MNGTRMTGAALALGALALGLAQAGCKRKDVYDTGPEMPVNPGVPGAAAGAPPPAMPPGGSMPAAPSPVQIAALEQAAAREPKNATAWIALGDSYFDSHQPAKAIEAYAKALALDPNNPNVLTDQGVMYRDLQRYDKALENFQKASKLDPGHVQSVFNMGVVYATNLNDPEKAMKAWNRVIEMAPSSPQATQARQLVAELKSRPGMR